MTAAPARLSTLLAGAGVTPLAAPGADPLIEGATLDSRTARPGMLFFALRGLRTNGEAFVPQAVERGAAAVVAASARPDWLAADVAWVQVEEPRRSAGLLARECYGRPDEALTLVGITGTNGKTTVTWLVEAVVAAAGHRAGRIGTTGYASAGVEQEAVRTTPEAPAFFRMLAEMADAKVDVVAAEVSSHAMALNRVEGARFAVAAFLNLGRDHLDFHGDTESYFEAKASLFDRLGPEQHAILPAGDPWGTRIAERTCARVTTFGRDEGADVRLTEEHSSLAGSSAVLETPGGPIPVRTRLLGAFNLENVAAAAACALVLGLPAEAVTTGVLAVESVPGRMEPVDCGQDFDIVVDYAHTGDALEQLLRSLRSLGCRRLIVVFGCGGERDRGKRAPMGRIAAELADSVYITSDNPRDEDPATIVAEIAAGAAEVPGTASRVVEIVNRDEAIAAALAEAGQGDVVAIAGKGHENTQTIGARVVPFDDRDIAAAALARLGCNGGAHA